MRSSPLIYAALLLVVVGCSEDRPLPRADMGEPPADLGPGAVDDGSQVPDGAADMPGLPGAGVRSDCNPLGAGVDCLLPFPSDVFLSNGQVVLGESATPRDKFGAPIRAFDARTADGFAVYPSILFTFGEGIDPESLTGPSAAEISVTPQSATLLIDASTGTAVPHYSEVYLGGGEDLQIGAIRPLVRLQEGRRYVVAVQGARSVAGTPVVPTEVFAALRDAAPVDAGLSVLRDRYESEVFGVLTQFGVDRSNLDLAWDFTTRTRDDLMGDMLSVRAGTLAWLESNEPTVTITDVVEGDELGVNLEDHTFRRVEGHFLAPLWTETDEPGAGLRGPLGAREIVGTTQVGFSLTIPNSVGTDPTARPARFLQFGHGFFGTRGEVLSFVQSKFGDDNAFVMGAVEWVGMTRADRDWVVGALGADPAAAFGFVPRVHQGMANQLVFTEVVRTLLAAETAVELDGSPAYDPAQVYFFGISQGHILGGTFMALTPSIERAVLNVGGASFGLILTRSYAFVLYEFLLKQWMEPLELLKFEAIAPQILEVIDPIAYAPLVVAEPLPGTVPRQVLLQGGIGDTAVPNVSLELHARALGIPLVTPSPASVPMLDEVAAPAPSGLTYFDFGLDPGFARAWEPVNMDTIVHEGVRRFGGAREQINRFLRPGGQIEDTCNGPCVVP